MAKYVVKKAGFINGRHHEEGEHLELSLRSARYLLMTGHIAELNGQKNVPTKTEPSPATLNRKTR